MARRAITARSLAIFFLLCTLADFILGYIHARTLSAALGRALFGLISTLVILAIWWLAARNDDTTDPP